MGTAVGKGGLTIEIADRDIDRATRTVQEYLRSEHGEDYPDWVITGALRNWIEKRAEAFGEDLSEILTSPQRAESGEFRRVLEETAERVEILDEQLQDVPEEASVFTGNRPFAPQKLAAMTAYIAARGREIYKTKLNKLLFYSDFINYYLHGNSISGARYVHLPYGPVPDRYESMLAEMNEAGTIEIEKRPGYERITATANPGEEDLSKEERETLDWVLENYGHMSAGAISELSHREMAYRFTRTGEEIAYEYAKFFENLPASHDPNRT